MEIILLETSILPFLGVGVLVLIIATAFIVGMIRNRNFQYRQELHETVARQTNLKLAYQSPQQYKMYGEYRGYPVKISSIELMKSSKEDVKFVSKIRIDMINPNRKSILISLPGASLTKLVPLDDPVKVKHNAQEWLDIYTNDMMFSSLLLSDDVKISVGAFFQSKEQNGVIYIYDDELACIFPELLLKSDQVNVYKKALDVLCDIKDELN